MWGVIVGLALAAYATTAARAQDVRVEIVEYGLYTAEKTASERDAKGVLRSALTTVRHAATTTTVPAELGVRFGFRYRVIGNLEGEQIELTKFTIYPPAGVKPPQSLQPLQKSETKIKPKIGVTAYTDYGFDDTWELVPGKWTIQLWQGNRKLAEQSFTVTKR